MTGGFRLVQKESLRMRTEVPQGPVPFQHPLICTYGGTIFRDRDNARYLRLSRPSGNFRHCETPSATVLPRHTAASWAFLILPIVLLFEIKSSHVCHTGSSQAGVGAKGAVAGMSRSLSLVLLPLLHPPVPARAVRGVCVCARGGFGIVGRVLGMMVLRMVVAVC